MEFISVICLFAHWYLSQHVSKEEIVNNRKRPNPNQLEIDQKAEVMFLNILQLHLGEHLILDNINCLNLDTGNEIQGQQEQP